MKATNANAYVSFFIISILLSLYFSFLVQLRFWWWSEEARVGPGSGPVHFFHTQSSRLQIVRGNLSHRQRRHQTQALKYNNRSTIKEYVVILFLTLSSLPNIPLSLSNILYELYSGSAQLAMLIWNFLSAHWRENDNNPCCYKNSFQP